MYVCVYVCVYVCMYNSYLVEYLSDSKGLGPTENSLLFTRHNSTTQTAGTLLQYYTILYEQGTTLLQRSKRNCPNALCATNLLKELNTLLPQGLPTF